ncbi:ATP-binding cassette domain-containing protein [Novosphingopyxis sp.]|uniref:ATP-binding cassette domain-containing protein n=1 Tax=Novosphingopyxis sp. TaxID=2709690 RepID=UPI003B5A00B5
MSAAIVLDRVTVQRDWRRVIHGVSLTIMQGGWFGLIGANGSGKTSLLRAIGGRLAFEDGQCCIHGTDMTSSRFGRAERIGFAPTVESLPTSLSPAEVFAFLSRDWQEHVAFLQKPLGLNDLNSRRIGTFSAGMRQRVAVACAFASGLDTMILDEPFNWLDPVAAFDLRIALREWVNPERTLITAVHDLATLAMSCDRGALLANGFLALTLDEKRLKDSRNNVLSFENEMIQVLRENY